MRTRGAAKADRATYGAGRDIQRVRTMYITKRTVNGISIVFGVLRLPAYRFNLVTHRNTTFDARVANRWYMLGLVAA